MGEAHHNITSSPLFSKALRVTSELNFWLTALATDNLNIKPTDLFSNPCSKGFRNRLLRRKPGRKMNLGSLLALTIFLLRRSEIEELIEISQVSFKNYSDQVIEDYLETVPVLDKAGGYAIQDHGEWLVEEIEGDYHNIVGLPLTKVLAHLAKLGFDLPQNDT
ncbi:Maf family protein [Akkermansiaceae bacterium]|nr:Maf family protein [Akkermansiaceae bacterium]